jgi:hypothetical protein
MPYVAAFLWHTVDMWDALKRGGRHRQAFAGVGVAWSLFWLGVMLEKRLRKPLAEIRRP